MTFIILSSSPAASNITDASLDLSTVVNTAPGNSLDAEFSDNWPITWAANGHQYTSWGDGGGFGGDNTSGRVSFGGGRLEGDIGNFSAFNVHGGFNPENANTLPDGKSKGIISVSGTLWMWRSGDGSDASGYNIEELYKSTDNGASWATVGSPQVVWLKTDSPPKGFSNLSFIQYGQDYAGVPDHAKNGSTAYLYSVGFDEKQGDWNVQEPGDVILMRVPVDQIETKSAYEWYSGSGPTWTGTYNNRAPIISSSDGMMRLSCCYNPVLSQYILIAQQNDRLLVNDAFIGMWKADRPWGPWTRFLYEDANDGSWCTNAGGGNPSALATSTKTVFWNISQKWSWLTPQGTDFVLVGTLDGPDEFGIVQGTLTVT